MAGPIGSTGEPDSPVDNSEQEPATGLQAGGNSYCVYANQMYSEGSEVCMVGKVHRCYIRVDGPHWWAVRPEREC
ncbi:MAG: hypothetical protein M3320_06030 [Actinomycetota bacterium]|nr:hypothetical protein [Actinomycetota bacterium]MDQ5808217.1 hypothetical protein [Actinomycetota bacterium]